MTEHFTRDEAVALAKAAGFDVRRGLGLRESVPEDVFARGLINEEVTALCNAAVTAKLKEWEAQGAVAWQCKEVGGTFWQDCSKERALVRAANPSKWEVRELYTHALPAQPAEPVNAELVEALDDAATSLETISRLAGKTHYVGNDGERLETYMEHHDQVRGYAISRASVVRAALSRAQAAPAVGVPDDYDLGVLRELSATLRYRSPERHAALERLLAASAQPQQKEGV